MIHQRGRLKPRRNLGALKDATWYLQHKRLADPSEVPSYPIDVTEGISDWGMCGNDEWGDCFSAAEWHQEMATQIAGGRPTLSPTGSTALDRARAYWGKSVKGPPGPGAVLATFLTWCVRKGIIKAFAPLDRSDRSTMAWFMSQGYGLYCGVSLNSQAEQQFDAGKPWDVSSVDPVISTDGHCIMWSKSQSPTGPHGFVTWGKLQIATERWVEMCLVNNPDGEVFVLVTTEDELAPFGPQLLTDVQSLANQQAETEICAKRGHHPVSAATLVSTGVRTFASKNTLNLGGPVESICKWCGTRYHYENVLVERPI